jgi:serine/threonine protein kinase
MGDDDREPGSDDWYAPGEPTGPLDETVIGPQWSDVARDPQLVHDPVSAGSSGNDPASSGAAGDLQRGLARLKPLLEPPQGEWEVGGITPTHGRRAGERISLREVYRGGGNGLILIGISFVKNEILAFKTVDLSKIADSQLKSVVKRMHREIKVQGGVNDGHLLELMGYGELPHADVPVPYFITRFVNGRSLKEKLVRWSEAAPAAGPLPQFEAIRILRELAVALQKLHSQSPPACHRDVKPDNVLLESRVGPHEQCEAVILADLGLVRSDAMPAVTDKIDIVGTRGYIAKEILSRVHEQPQPPSDIFSLGVVAYEMIAGRHPFQHDVIPVLRGDMPPTPEAVDSCILPALSQLVVRMLSHEETVRPTAEELVRELDAMAAAAPPRDVSRPRPAGWPPAPADWEPWLRAALARDFGFPGPWLDLIDSQPMRFRVRAGLLTVLRALMTIREKFQSTQEKLITCCCSLEPTWRGAQQTGEAVTDQQRAAWQVGLESARRTIREATEQFFGETQTYREVARLPEFGNAYRHIEQNLMLLREETGVGIADVPLVQEDPGNAVEAPAGDVDAPSALVPAILKTFDRLQTAINHLLRRQHELVALQIQVKDFLLVELAASSPV